MLAEGGKGAEFDSQGNSRAHRLSEGLMKSVQSVPVEIDLIAEVDE